jgi:branched-chain amino acid transport system substrate-binding protein
MYEIRIHGRGGQGAVLAGGILATALVLEGKFVVAVPSFGFARRGAPAASYLRFDEREIRQMTNTYHPDCVLCIDRAVRRWPAKLYRPIQTVGRSLLRLNFRSSIYGPQLNRQLMGPQLPRRSTTMSSHLSRLIVSKALITRGVAVVAALLLGAAPLVASAQARPVMRIGAVIASSGPASFLGVPEKNAIELAAEKFKNDRSLPFDVEFIVYDDASDPTKSVNSARRLINEDNVHVVICCTTTPASMAILETINSTGVLNISMASAAGVIEPADQRKWTFKTPTTDRLMIARTLDYMIKKGYKKIAFFGNEDSYGESGLAELRKLAPAKGVELVAIERFGRTDTNFTPQALRIKQANPDAVYFHSIPPSAVLAHQSLARVGYHGPIFHSAGSANGGFLSVGGDSVEGAIVGTGPGAVYDQMSAGNPLKPVATDFAKLYDGKYGAGKTDLFAGQGWDAALLAEKAVEIAYRTGASPAKLQEFRVKTRDAMEGIKNFPGTMGVFNFTPQDHLGLDRRSTVLVVVKNNKFVLLDD